MEDLKKFFPSGCNNFKVEVATSSISDDNLNIELDASADCPCLLNDKETCFARISIKTVMESKKKNL